MTHTPGPWEIRRSKSGYPYQICAPNEDSRKPGKIVSVTRWASISCPSLPEGEANARLIAKAPEMAARIAEQDAIIKELVEALGVHARRARRRGYDARGDEALIAKATKGQQ